MIYLNLPVKDFQHSIDFYKSLGFTQNLEFSDEFGAAMVWSPEIWLLLLTYEYFKKFSQGREIPDAHKTAQVLTTLSFESKEAVDRFVSAAETNGGAVLPELVMEDADGMYIRDIADPDGHIWEAVYREKSG